MFDESVLLRKTSGGEGGDKTRHVRKWQVRLSYQSFTHVRVHDQFYSQTEASARKVHDEQRSRELHHTSGTLIAVHITMLRY